LDVVDELFLDLFGDGPLAAGGLDAAHDVVAVEGGAGAVALDDGETGGLLDSLVGGEAAAAGDALTPAADDLARVAGAAVDPLVVVGVAERADHGGLRAGYGDRAWGARQLAVGRTKKRTTRARGPGH